MDEIKVRELPEKSSVKLTDSVIIEDEDGTKTAKVHDIVSAVQQGMYFNTLDDLKKATLHEGDVVFTLGRRKVGDGGGAHYQIVYAPTDVDDGAFVHYLATSDTLRAHLIHGPQVDILVAGARGDGVTDDYKVIQTILDKGYTPYFPRVEVGYCISKSLELKSNTILDLNGNTLIKTISTAVISLGKTTEAKNITIRNGKLKAPVAGVDIYDKARDIKIIECTVEPSTNSCVGINIYGAENVHISNCTIGNDINGTSTGININAALSDTAIKPDNIRITGCEINCKSSADGIVCSAAKYNIVIDDCIISCTGNEKLNRAIIISLLSTYDYYTIFKISNIHFKNVQTCFYIFGNIASMIDISNISLDKCLSMIKCPANIATISLSGAYPHAINIGELNCKLICNTAGRYLFGASGSGQIQDMSDPRLLYSKYSAALVDNNGTRAGYITIGGKNTNIAINVTILSSSMASPNLDSLYKIDSLGSSVDGQVVTLYSDVSIRVYSNPVATDYIKLKDATVKNLLDGPITLQKRNGIWCEI